ncbi:MAG: FAD-dependent thymidylate synthase [Candidatus Pacearchaeota archaeon]
MEVKLVGINVPLKLLEKIKQGLSLSDAEKNALTPETITAAYARISRSNLSVDELLENSINDTESARRSITNILGIGHQSIADHAIFNFNIQKVSRLAVEAIEERRLAGYTEKSQRYVTLTGDYVRPKEFSQEDLEKFEKLVALQNNFYFEANKKLFDYLREKYAKKIGEMKSENEKEKILKKLENSAKEDARYSLSLATETQLGCSYTGQTLEYAIRVNKYGKLDEQREFAKKLFEETVKIAPSLIQLTDAELFEQIQGKKLVEDNFKSTRKNLEEVVEKTIKKYLKKINAETCETLFTNKSPDRNVIRIIHGNLDVNILAALIHRNSKLSIVECYALAILLIQNNDDKNFFLEGLKYLSEYDKMPREFEISGLIFEAIVSASCFAQLKRHRMNTLLAQDYNPELGYTIPPNIQEIGFDKKLKEVCDVSSELYYEFSKYGKAAEYCLTNAHKRRVLLATNLRQLYHLSRTREDENAQWEIRKLFNNISYLVKQEAPITTLLLGGQHEFVDLRKKLYKD